MNISKETEQVLFEIVKIILSIPMMILNIILGVLGFIAVVCFSFRDIDFTIALFQHYFVAFYGFELKLVHIYLVIASLHLLTVICYRTYLYIGSYRKYSSDNETLSVMGEPNLKETSWITVFGYTTVYQFSNEPNPLMAIIMMILLVVAVTYLQTLANESRKTELNKEENEIQI